MSTFASFYDIRNINIPTSFSSSFKNLIKTSQVAMSTSSKDDAGYVSYKQWSISNPLKLYFNSRGNGKENVCYICTSRILDFIYLGSMQMQKDHVNHIAQLGEAFGIPEVLKECKKFNKKNGRETELGFDTGLVKLEVLFSNGYCNNSNTKSNENGIDTVKSFNTNYNLVLPPVNMFDLPKYKVHGTLGNKLLTNTTVIPTVIEMKSLKDNDSKVHIKNAMLEANIGTNVTRLLHKNDNESELCGVYNHSSLKRLSSDFSCSVCSHCFESQEQLNQHRYFHLGHFYRCYTCRFYAHKPYDLYKHIKEAKHKEKVCSFCMFEAENEETLIVHVEEHSDPEKPFLCIKCSKQFSTKGKLKDHIIKHSEMRTFVCEVCNKCFKRKEGLSSHMVIHSLEKKFLCPFCGYTTVHRTTFERHVLIHSSGILKCQHEGCHFKTNNKYNLKSHLLTHKQCYQCEICGRSFSRIRNLRRHIVRHDRCKDSNPCPLCSFKSQRWDKLVSHFKRLHPGRKMESVKCDTRKKTFDSKQSVNEVGNNVEQFGEKTCKVSKSAITDVQKGVSTVHETNTWLHLPLDSVKAKDIAILTTNQALSISNQKCSNINHISPKISSTPIHCNSSLSVVQHPHNSSKDNKTLQLISRKYEPNVVQSVINISGQNAFSIPEKSGQSNVTGSEQPIQEFVLNSNGTYVERVNINTSFVASMLNCDNSGINSSVNKNLTNVNLSNSQTSVNNPEALNYDSLLDSLETSQLELPTLDDSITLMSNSSDLGAPMSFVSGDKELLLKKLIHGNFISDLSANFPEMRHNISTASEIQTNKDTESSVGMPENIKVTILNATKCNTDQSNNNCQLPLNVNIQKNVNVNKNSNFESAQPIFQSLETFLDIDDM